MTDTQADTGIVDEKAYSIATAHLLPETADSWKPIIEAYESARQQPQVSVDNIVEALDRAIRKYHPQLNGQRAYAGEIAREVLTHHSVPMESEKGGMG